MTKHEAIAKLTDYHYEKAAKAKASSGETDEYFRHLAMATLFDEKAEIGAAKDEPKTIVPPAPATAGTDGVTT